MPCLCGINLNVPVKAEKLAVSRSYSWHLNLSPKGDPVCYIILQSYQLRTKVSFMGAGKKYNIFQCVTF
jgi:hypothetical protein